MIGAGAARYIFHTSQVAECLRAQRPSEAILFTAESIADFATDSSPSQDVLQSVQSSIWASLGLAGISATGDSPNYRDGKTQIKDNKSAVLCRASHRGPPLHKERGVFSSLTSKNER